MYPWKTSWRSFQVNFQRLCWRWKFHLDFRHKAKISLLFLTENVKKKWSHNFSLTNSSLWTRLTPKNFLNFLIFPNYICHHIIKKRLICDVFSCSNLLYTFTGPHPAIYNGRELFSKVQKCSLISSCWCTHFQLAHFPVCKEK